MDAWGVSFETVAPPEPNGPAIAPTPTYAEWHRATQKFTVWFTTELQTRLLNLENWQIKANRVLWQTEDAGAQYTRVKGGARFGVPTGPGSTVSYSPPPFDVRSLADVPAAAFTDFPLTVV